MFEIYEVSAAPHFPEALKSVISHDRPEIVLALTTQAFEKDSSIEVRMREGEIFVALTAS